VRLSKFRLSSPPTAELLNPASTPVLALDDLTKHFKTGTGVLAAVSNVSLEIAPGELTALMGPSGSGKTTLLEIMGAILRPTRGRVAICGREVSTLSEAERSAIRLAHVGFVFQSYHLFPTLTARQNVEVALDLRGIKGRTRRIEAEDLLDQVELNDKANTYPADLSGGQKQRVAIARALAGSPSVILADEPTAALDSMSGRRITKLFRGLARTGQRSVVIVTHDSRIADFADRVLQMEDGRIVADQPRHRSVAPTSPARLTSIPVSLIQSGST
jgi:putative ABC transport system ATP-binding protein